MTGYHSVPEVVINLDGPEECRVGFIDDFGGKIELSTHQFRNLIALLVSRGILADHLTLGAPLAARRPDH